MSPPNGHPSGEQASGEQLSIDVEHVDRYAVVRLAGELDIVSVGGFRAILDELMLESDPVIVDLRDLDFIDSAGLGALVRAHKKARVLQSQLTCVCLPQSQAASLFRVTGLHRVLRIVSSLDDELGPARPDLCGRG